MIQSFSGLPLIFWLFLFSQGITLEAYWYNIPKSTLVNYRVKISLAGCNCVYIPNTGNKSLITLFEFLFFSYYYPSCYFKQYFFQEQILFLNKNKRLLPITMNYLSQIFLWAMGIGLYVYIYEYIISYNIKLYYII